MQPTNDAHKLLFHSIPILICWHLWKNRCNVKYVRKISNPSRVRFCVWKDCFNIINVAYPYVNWPFNWIGLVSMLENSIQESKVTTITWTNLTLVGLSSDGSALSNLGKISSGWNT